MKIKLKRVPLSSCRNNTRELDIRSTSRFLFMKKIMRNIREEISRFYWLY